MPVTTFSPENADLIFRNVRGQDGPRAKPIGDKQIRERDELI